MSVRPGTPAGTRETVRSADGTSIAFRRVGSGPAVLLLHGAAVGAGCWSRVIPTLAESFTTAVMDRRGRGESSDRSPYGAGREIEDIRAVLAAIGHPVHLIGHSSGALLALEVARVSPEVAGLVVYEPPILVEPDPLVATLAERLRSLVAANNRDAALRLFFAEGPRLDAEEVEMIARSPLWPAALALAHTVAYDVELTLALNATPERWAALPNPVLVLCGSASPTWVRSGLEMLASALPNGHLAELAGQTHGALWSAPGLLAGTAADFLLGENGMIRS